MVREKQNLLPANTDLNLKQTEWGVRRVSSNSETGLTEEIFLSFHNQSHHPASTGNHIQALHDSGRYRIPKISQVRARPEGLEVTPGSDRVCGWECSGRISSAESCCLTTSNSLQNCIPILFLCPCEMGIPCFPHQGLFLKQQSCFSNI